MTKHTAVDDAFERLEVEAVGHKIVLEPVACRWCGSSPRVDNTDGWFRVECDCGACGPVFGDEDAQPGENRYSAIETWNFIMTPTKEKPRK